MPVIVTNAKNRIAYNITRSLSLRGIKVHTADFVSPAMTFASRYSAGNFTYPSPFSEQQAFIDCIIERCLSLKADVLIPVFEETFLMAKHKEELRKHVKIVLPDYQKILLAHNKNQWSSIAKELDIPVPKNYSSLELQNDEQLLEDFRFPVLIKPHQGGGGWAIKQFDTLGALKSLLKDSLFSGLPWDRFFIQEKIQGETFCVAMLFRQGQYRAKSTYKQLREFPVNAGQATLRESIRLPAAEEYFQKLLEHLEWDGICQADFIVEKHTGIPYLIDINPRFWGSLAQGIASGVDFPFLLYRIAMEGDIAPVESFREGVRSRWLGGDLRTFYPSMMQSASKIQFLRDYFFSGYNQNVFFDDFSLKDPLPFMVWSLDAMKKILRSRSVNPSTHDSLDGVWE